MGHLQDVMASPHWCVHAIGRASVIMDHTVGVNSVMAVSSKRSQMYSDLVVQLRNSYEGGVLSTWAMLEKASSSPTWYCISCVRLTSQAMHDASVVVFVIVETKGRHFHYTYAMLYFSEDLQGTSSGTWFLSL
jgi:hypothetical protein